MGKSTTIAKGCGWVTILSWMVLLVLMSLQLPNHTGAAPTTSAQAQPKETHVHHIAALLKVSNFTSAKQVFLDAIDSANRDPSTKVTLAGIPLKTWSSPNDNIEYVCDAVFHQNVTTFLVIGPQKIINILSIITNYVGIPVVGYNKDSDQVGAKVSGLHSIT